SDGIFAADERGSYFHSAPLKLPMINRAILSGSQIWGRASQRSITAATPTLFPGLSFSTRTTVAWQHTHWPPNRSSSGGIMRTISSLELFSTLSGVKKNKPRELMSLSSTWARPESPKVTLAGSRHCTRGAARFSCFGLDIMLTPGKAVADHHKPALRANPSYCGANVHRPWRPRGTKCGLVLNSEQAG